jgi:hypothetical protein
VNWSTHHELDTVKTRVQAATMKAATIECRKTGSGNGKYSKNCQQDDTNPCGPNKSHFYTPFLGKSASEESGARDHP